MNARRLTLLSALLVLVAVIAASAVPQSEALAEGDLHIDTIDGNDLSLTLDSGTSKTVNLYVTNNGDTPVALSVDSVSNLGDSISVSTKITVLDSANPDSGVLMPAGHDGNMAIIEITVSADAYSDNKTAVGTVTLLANSIGDDDGGVEIACPITVGVTSVFATGDAYNKFFGVFPNTLDAPFNSVWVTALATLIIWIIATVIMSEIIIPLFTRLVGARKTQEEKRSLTKRLTSMITVVMFVIAVNECVQIVGANAGMAHFIGALSMVVYVVVGSLIAWMVYLFIVTAFLKGLDEAADVDGVDMSLLPLLKMIGNMSR